MWASDAVEVLESGLAVEEFRIRGVEEAVDLNTLLSLRHNRTDLCMQAITRALHVIWYEVRWRLGHTSAGLLSRARHRLTHITVAAPFRIVLQPAPAFCHSNSFRLSPVTSYEVLLLLS